MADCQEIIVTISGTGEVQIERESLKLVDWQKDASAQRHQLRHGLNEEKPA